MVATARTHTQRDTQQKHIPVLVRTRTIPVDMTISETKTDVIFFAARSRVVVFRKKDYTISKLPICHNTHASCHSIPEEWLRAKNGKVQAVL